MGRSAKRHQLHAIGAGQDRNIIVAASLRVLASIDGLNIMVIDSWGEARNDRVPDLVAELIRSDIEIWLRGCRTGEQLLPCRRAARCQSSLSVPPISSPWGLLMPGASGRQCCRPCPYGVAAPPRCILAEIE